MPAFDNTSRGYFRTLHGSLLRQLRPIRANELELMRKSPRTPAEEARLKELSKARREITQNIITLSDTEDAYLRSAFGVKQALKNLKSARDKAVRTTRSLNSINKALGTLSTITKIVTDLARIFAA